MRADNALVQRGHARSRTAAAQMIKRGLVRVNSTLISKPSREIHDDDFIEIIVGLPFVSRGGEKLERALEHFSIEVKGATALDIGSSTGGFTDCLLKRGAKKIYAVDVGTNQLDTTLRNDPRVTVMEQTDIRNAQIPEPADLAVIDVSFIPLEKVLPSTKRLITDMGSVIALIKPQFEVGKDRLNRKGIVREALDRTRAVHKVVAAAEKVGFATAGIIESPITGGDGNIEYLAYFKNQKSNTAIDHALHPFDI